MNIAEIRDSLKSKSGVVTGCPDGLGEVCRMAISKIITSAELPHREFTDEEIKNAMRAYWKERGSGYYEFKLPHKINGTL